MTEITKTIPKTIVRTAVQVVPRPLETKSRPMKRTSDTELPVRERVSAKSVEFSPKTKPARNKQGLQGLGNLEKNILRSAVDAFVFRAPIRVVERLIDNPLLRGIFRIGTEVGRKNGEQLFVNYLNGKNGISSSDFRVSSLRVLEHAATFVFEPANVSGSIMKGLFGLGNNLLREGIGYGFLKSGALKKTEVDEKGFIDRNISRSALRWISTDSNNPLIQGLVKGTEQFAINMNLHVGKPYERLLPNFSKTIEKIFNVEA